MPQPVVSGFMSGIGIIIIILQFAPMVRHDAPDGSVLMKLVALPAMLQDINYNSLILGLMTLFVIVMTPEKIKRTIPPQLVAITLGTIAGIYLFKEVPVIGVIPSGVPVFQMPAIPISELSNIIKFSLVLAFLGSIDSLLTSLVVDSLTRSSHDSNKELVGQGIGNIASGLFGGLPAAGATMRTLVNARAGATTGLSGAFH